MNIQATFPKITISSKPVLQTIGNTKVLKFQVDDHGNEVTMHMWGKHGEAASKYLNIGHELSALGRMMPGNNGKGAFVVDRILTTEKSWVSRHLTYWKAMLLIKLEELWPFERKTVEVDVPAKESLVDMVLEWWEENKHEEYPMGDGEWDNLYNEEPDFVTEARNIKEEVKEDD